MKTVIPKISVITVVYNGELYIEATIQSVLSQTYEDIEYIIIDGGSTDSTVDIIKRYESGISYWVSEPDDGIYDAMNKGIEKASGKWINFMNAGDVFFDANVLSEVFAGKQHDAKILYGDVVVDYGGFQKYLKAGSLESLWKGMQFSHQSCFIDSSYHKKNLYTLEYRAGGDFDFFYKAYISDVSFSYISKAISVVITDGVADSNRMLVYNDWEDVLKKNNHYSVFVFFQYTINKNILKIKNLIKAILPSEIVRYLIKKRKK